METEKKVHSNIEKPLLDMRIVVTRARSQSQQFMESIAQLGGIPCELPVIDIKKPDDADVIAQIKQALQAAPTYDWIVFTSVNGVEHFMYWLDEMQLELKRFVQARIAAVGPKTAEALKKYGLHVEQLPDHYHAEGLLELLQGLVHPGQKVLLPRGNLARRILPDTLRNIGIDAVEITVYYTVAAQAHELEALEWLKRREVDIITFASSSAVNYFVEMLLQNGIGNPLQLLEHVPLASIGPLTSQTIRSIGLEAAIEAEHSTMQHMLEAIVNYTNKAGEDR